MQLCIVHLVRIAPRLVTWKDRRTVAADLKPICQAAVVKEAQTNLNAFENTWDKHYPSIFRSWRKGWEHIIPFFDYPKDIRKVIYTTNAIESMNRSLLKIIKIEARSLPMKPPSSSCFWPFATSANAGPDP